MLIFPLINDLSRKSIHIDMDAFFAAVEIRDNPKLKENLSSLEVTQDKQVGGELFLLVATRHEPLVFTLP